MLSIGRGLEEDKMIVVFLHSRKVGFTRCKQMCSQINEKRYKKCKYKVFGWYTVVTNYFPQECCWRIIGVDLAFEILDLRGVCVSLKGKISSFWERLVSHLVISPMFYRMSFYSAHLFLSLWLYFHHWSVSQSM